MTTAHADLARRASQRGSIPRSPLTGRQGLSPDQVSHQLASQSFLCMICKGALLKDWVVDHDHALAARHGHNPQQGCQRCFRAILCKGCNLMLGWARDDPERLEVGAAYLRAAAEKLR